MTEMGNKGNAKNVHSIVPSSTFICLTFCLFVLTEISTSRHFEQLKNYKFLDTSVFQKFETMTFCSI